MAQFLLSLAREIECLGTIALITQTGRGKSAAELTVKKTFAALFIAGAAYLGVAASAVSCLAEDAQIAGRRQAERLDFSDSEIAEGFFKVAFGAELQLDGSKDHIRKFGDPVRIYVD